jgi:hypothetical protein
MHQHGDRTASVGLRTINNTVKCFGCDVGPLGPVDLVMEVLGLKNPGEAARWIAERFQVPNLPARKNLLEPERRIFQFGLEREIGVLVHSGLWARLSLTARALVPVLLELGERDGETRTISLQISYMALGRYGGVSSPNAIAGALRELQRIGWLSIGTGPREPGSAPARETSVYLLTPRSDELLELAQSNCAQMRDEITIQRKLRTEARAKRKRDAY